jgi:3-oxoacyl-[acyl-carrier protein] reductase
MVFAGRFEGQVAAVTGGASGIGLAIAARLRAEGARVVLVDRAREGLEKAAAAIGAGVSIAPLDVTDTDAAAAFADGVERDFGRLDVLVNSAGVAGPNHLAWEYPSAAFREVVEINLVGTFLMCRAVVPLMLRNGYGRIVNIASIAGKEGNPTASAYSAAKAGVIGFTKSLGKELAQKGVVVNAVTPATINTPILSQVTQEFIAYMLSKIPMGRFGELEEAASLVTWLASRECSFSTASVFDLSGGRATY